MLIPLTVSLLAGCEFISLWLVWFGFVIVDILHSCAYLRVWVCFGDSVWLQVRVLFCCVGCCCLGVFMLFWLVLLLFGWCCYLMLRFDWCLCECFVTLLFGRDGWLVCNGCG